MQILMGGSGSTGSSLLKNILNRNKAIFAGGETSFFAKERIYTQWSKAKGKVLWRGLPGLRNFGWHYYNGTDLLQDEYLWNKYELKSLLKASSTLHDFTSQFYAKAMFMHGAGSWLEKTPANSACFAHFLSSYSNGKVIHIVRDPYDTIASLMSRGFNIYYAVGVYLLNTASGLSVKSSTRYKEVKYESLVTYPTDTVKGLCDFLDVKFTDEMLEPQGEQIEKSKLKGWNYDETKPIGTNAIGRFERLSAEDQKDIIEAVRSVYINKKGKNYYNLEIESIEDICDTLGYNFFTSTSNTTYDILKIMRRTDRITRIRRGYPTGIKYPLSIKKQ